MRAASLPAPAEQAGRAAGDLGLQLDKQVKLEWHRAANMRTRCMRITTVRHPLLPRPTPIHTPPYARAHAAGSLCASTGQSHACGAHCMGACGCGALVGAVAAAQPVLPTC